MFSNTNINIISDKNESKTFLIENERERERRNLFRNESD